MQTHSFRPTDLNDGFVVAITLEARPGEEDAVATILDVMAAPTMAKPGVKLFLPYWSPTNPALFFVFELYVDEAGWGAHEATAHFKEAVAGLLPRVIRRERVPFVPFIPLNTSARSSPIRAATMETSGPSFILLWSPKCDRESTCSHWSLRSGRRRMADASDVLISSRKHPHLTVVRI